MRGGLGRLLHALLVLAVAGFVGFLSTRLGLRADWSDAQRAALAPQSMELLQRLDAPVEVVSYASDSGSLRQGIAAFIERYRQHKTDVALAFVDPAADPAAMRKLGITVDGEIDLHGMTGAEAREALRVFIAEATARRMTCVRVIHGKGRRSGPRGPVLKNVVNLWLQRSDDVLAFGSARTVDGGSGAVYVLLRTR